MKVFPHGQGKGFGPVEYATAQNPFGKGVRSKSPQILKGDPAMLRRQIDTIPYKWKYSSGAFSFAPEDSPTDEQLAAVIEATEDLAFAGLPPSSRSILWVLHEEGRRKDLRFIIPRQEVHTGKAFNAFPPRWEKKFDHLRDMFNFKYGWVRPDDPARARPVRPGVQALIAADAGRKGKTAPADTKDAITERLIPLIEHGEIHNREDILRSLRGMGFLLPRIGADYITVLNPTDGRRTRLKGSLYTDSFSVSTWLAHREDKKKLAASPDPAKAAIAAAALQASVEKTAAYNRQRYQIPEMSASQEHIVDAASTSKQGKVPYEQHTPSQRFTDSQLFGWGSGKAPASTGWQNCSDPAHGNLNTKRNAKRLQEALQPYPGGTYRSGGKFTVRIRVSEGQDAKPHSSAATSRTVHGARSGPNGPLSGRADSYAAKSIQRFGRSAGRQSQTLGRHDESYQGYSQQTWRSSQQDRGASRSAAGATAAAKQIRRDRLEDRACQPAVFAGHIALATLPAMYASKQWEAAMRFLPPPEDVAPELAIGIAARTEQLASQTDLEHIGHALIANAWLKAQVPLALPGFDAMRALSAVCVFKAENLCASITADTVEADLLRQRWTCVLWAMLPRHQPDEQLVTGISERTAHIMERIVLEHIGHSLASDAWRAAQAPLALPGLDAVRELSSACVFKAENLCAFITADAFEADLMRQRWIRVWSILPRYQPDTRLVGRIEAQSGALAEDIAIQSTALLLRKQHKEIKEYAAAPGDFVEIERFPNTLPEKAGTLPAPDTEDLLTPSLQ